MHTQRSMKKFLLPVSMLLFIAIFCQRTSGVAHLGVDEGLSQGSVFDLVQDDQGFLWVATADGLNRFDGYNFKLFRSDPNDSASFLNAQLRGMYKGKTALWVVPSAKMELFRLDMLTQKVTKVYSYPSPSVRIKEMGVFYEEADTLWLLNSAAGVIKFNWHTNEVIKLFPEAVNAFPSANCMSFDSATSTLWYADVTNDIVYSFNIRNGQVRPQELRSPVSRELQDLTAIRYVRKNSVWLGSRNSICEFDPETEEFVHYVIPFNPDVVDRVVAFSPVVNGQLWCGTERGNVYVFDLKKKTFSKREEASAGPDNLARRVIRFLLDRSDNLWVGTDPDGLLRIDLKEKPFHHTFHDKADPQSLRNNFTKCFLQKGNELYIGMYNNGVSVMNRETGRHRYINGFENSSATMPVVFSMTEDSAGRIWAATSQGVGILKPGDAFFTHPREVNSDKRMLISGNTIFALNARTFLVGGDTSSFQLSLRGNTCVLTALPLQSRIEKFYLDKDGNLWAGAGDGIYFSKGGDPFGLKLILSSSGRGKCITQAENGTVWIGTENGLFRVDPATLLVTRSYTEPDGMPNNFVYGILEDKAHNLWISTNKGLSRFNPQTETFRNFSVSDGLQSNEFNTGAYYKNSEGEFFFGGVNGFNYFFPEEIADNPFAPQCVITGFSVFDQPLASDTAVEYRKHITLDHSQNNLLIQYTATEFTDPSKNRYRYRLAGLDTNWVDAGKERFARFIDVDPGDYIFQVKACNNDGLWNNTPMELRISVTPPFWATASFIISAVIIGLLLVILGIRFYFRRQLKLRTRELQLEQNVRMNAIFETEEKERKRIAGELHDGLGQLLSTARLNVSGFGETSDARNNVLFRNSLQLLDQACEEVRNISHNMMPGALIRMGLMTAVNELIIKINDTEKVTVHFDTNLETRLNETVEISVYRIVQEALNNMVKHSQAKNISLQLMRTTSSLEIRITDDGKGFDVSRIGESKGLGWKNMYSRVETLRGTIHIDSSPGKGTEIFITIPL
jgi:signal transduction histidine kinase/ligand-binding sensor domain-containing protein